MFNAKNLLEMLMKSAQPPAAPGAQQASAGGGGLGDLLGQILASQQAGGARSASSSVNPAAGGPAGGGGTLGDMLGRLGQQGANAGASPGSGGGLGDLLGQVLGHAKPGTAGTGGVPGQMPGATAPDAGSGGGLEDMLRKLQGQLGGANGGTIADMLKQVLGQATAGVSDGARRIDDATGASAHARSATQGATGHSPDEIMAQIKEWVANNQLGAGAAAGGLGAVVLGTRTGRSVAGQAVKLGSLALIGGLAYKALQNYQAGRPLVSAADAAQLTAAPQGTGYETAAVTNDSALLYIRAMIAAAAADGRIDANEQQKIFGGLKQAGLEAGAEEFLARELNSPASVEDLAAGVTTEQEAVQVFTAARIAIDLDTQQENEFLVRLATALGIDGPLAQHIDAAARGTA